MTDRCGDAILRVSAGILKNLAHIDKQPVRALPAETIVDADIGFGYGIELNTQARAKAWLYALQLCAWSR